MKQLKYLACGLIFGMAASAGLAVNGDVQKPDSTASSYPESAQLIPSPGNTTYLVDPVNGNDANPAGKPWKSYAKLNSMKLAPGDQVIISPGAQDETLKPSGEGTAEKPIVIRFLPGIHTIGIKNVIRLPMFVSNSQDSDEPKPIGVLIQNVKHLRVEGGGVEGPRKTVILYDGRMVQIFNDRSEDITFTGLVLDLKRPTVSEFRVLETGPNHAVIQVAEQSDYAIQDGRFSWTGDLGLGYVFCLEAIPTEGRCWRSSPRGWTSKGQEEARATDLGGRKVRLDYATGVPGLVDGHQYQFRNILRDRVGIHNARCARITFRDCDIYALCNMGFVSQFTDTITYQRVNVAPPKNTIRTCAAWADIFQFSNCKGDILVDSCRLSGSHDDPLNCHGTYLRIVEKVGSDQLRVCFAHPQTYGFAPFAAGDEIAVLSKENMREYPKNPRTHVVGVERITDKEWLVKLDGPAPAFEQSDVVDNITWNPNITIRNNHVDMTGRGFLVGTRGKIVIEGNTMHCLTNAVVVEGDAKRWMESSPIRDMLIRKNHFIKCGINIGANVKSIKPEEPIHENIRIEDNEFDGGGIVIRGAKGVTIKRNISLKEPLSIKLEDSCSETLVEGNQIKN